MTSSLKLETGARRNAVLRSSLIGHTKAEHRMVRDSDRDDAVLAAAGYNFALHLGWLARLLGALFRALATTTPRLLPA
jgi:hypothetical protein